MGKKTICLFLIVTLLLGSLLVLPGCQLIWPPNIGPQYFVDSYEQIKQDLAEDQPEIIYPDISRYERSRVLVYKVFFSYQGDRKIKSGYSIYSEIIDIRETDVDSVFSSVETSAVNIELYYSEPDERPSLEPSMTYRMVLMEYRESENTDWYVAQDLLGEGEGYLYPLGTREGTIGCSFDVDGYRYHIGVGVAMTPDDLEVRSYEAWMEAAREEVYLIIDSVLDQRGTQGGTVS
ncbi:MAG: hypothetical protein LBS98_05695 [Coriobacteriales bacterium]|jgi:hypothetical protein|nr:hypothetical protein [Coriobacteriales bacterium]